MKPCSPHPSPYTHLSLLLCFFFPRGAFPGLVPPGAGPVPREEREGESLVGGQGCWQEEGEKQPGICNCLSRKDWETGGRGEEERMD